MTKEIVNEGSNLGDEYNKALDTLKNGGDNLTLFLNYVFLAI